ncbi:hypothetical protein DERP_004206, partial [Dermatophagoides pteronyssinus]
MFHFIIGYIKCLHFIHTDFLIIITNNVDIEILIIGFSLLILDSLPIHCIIDIIPSAIFSVKWKHRCL